VKRVLISAAIVALATAGISSATAAPAVYKVTGGGQITTADQKGAGSTVAFTAQSAGLEGAASKGQFQLQLRTAEGQETVHGTISCVVVTSYTDKGGIAVMGGKATDGEPFRIDVSDTGEGGDVVDLILVRRGAEAYDGADNDDNQSNDQKLCDEEDEKPTLMFGRGNVQVHKAKA
jgi:hypothetical protein